jgi:phenylacetic acid degradation protein paaN
VYAEKSGVNVVVVDSTDDVAGMCANLAFSLALYTGQMCTAPQDVFLPRDGIDTDEGHVSVDELGARIGAALDRLLGDDARAVEVLGAAVDDGVLERLEQAAGTGRVLVPSRSIRHPSWPQARVRTPLLVALDADDDAATYGQECFGPVAYLVTTASTSESLRRLYEVVSRSGAMTASVYSTSPAVLERARETALDAGVALSENLTGGVYVNQSAAFSDFHGTGANPAAGAAYTDGAYVTGRFHVVQSRRHVPAPASAG